MRCSPALLLALFLLPLTGCPTDDDDDSAEWTPRVLTPAEQCVEECDEYLFFECIEEDRAVVCRDACAIAGDALIDTFLTCDGALDCRTECVDALAP